MPLEVGGASSAINTTTSSTAILAGRAARGAESLRAAQFVMVRVIESYLAARLAQARTQGPRSSGY